MKNRVRQTSQVIGRQVRHLRHVVADAVEQVTPLIQSRRHDLALHLQPDMMKVCGDKKRLVQVVANILNNAAKYTHEGGNIVLRVEVLAAHVVIEITDNGIGMERDLALRAFDLFAQAERTPDRSSGGLGLGLALVKSLTELHGGRASCKSAGLGKGSTFCIHLPRMVESKSEPDRHKNLDRDVKPEAHSLQF